MPTTIIGDMDAGGGRLFNYPLQVWLYKEPYWIVIGFPVSEMIESARAREPELMALMRECVEAGYELQEKEPEWAWCGPKLGATKVLETKTKVSVRASSTSSWPDLPRNVRP